MYTILKRRSSCRYTGLYEEGTAKPAQPSCRRYAVKMEANTACHTYKLVVHKFFGLRATNCFLKPFGGQRSAITQLMYDKCMQKFSNTTCALSKKQTYGVNKELKGNALKLLLGPYYYNSDSFSMATLRTDTNSKVVHRTHL